VLASGRRRHIATAPAGEGRESGNDTAADTARLIRCGCGRAQALGSSAAVTSGIFVSYFEIKR
jgi:hypothetical protein